MSEKIYSVELQENEWADDTYTGGFEDCVEFCNENYYKIDGVDARIAEIQYDEDGSSKCISTVCNVNYDVRKGWSYDDDFWNMPDITHAEFMDFEIDWKREIAENYDEIMEHINGETEDYEITVTYYFSPEYDSLFESDSPESSDTITAAEILDIIKQKDFELLKLKADLRKSYKDAFVTIAFNDYEEKLEYENYYLSITKDAKMIWHPGQKEGAVSYTRNRALLDMSEWKAYSWIHDRAELECHENFEALMEQFYDALAEKENA